MSTDMPVVVDFARLTVAVDTTSPPSSLAAAKSRRV